MAPGTSYNIACVVFDMDGTLTVSNLDFDGIREEAGIPDGEPILEYLDSAPAPERERGERVLHAHEREAIRNCRLRPGVNRVFDALRQAGVKIALLTRNSRSCVEMLIERFEFSFDCWVSREDAAPKPSPEPLLKIARCVGVPPSEMLMVGDYKFDMQAGRAAGARTAFLETNYHREVKPEADVVISDLRELLDYLCLTLQDRG